MSTEAHFEHGTVTTYTNHKCRCEECRHAWAAYVRSYRAANKDRLQVKVRARSRAYTRLAKMYPGEFKLLFETEMSKEGPTTTQFGGFDPDIVEGDDYEF